MSKQKKNRVAADLSPREIAALLEASQISEEEIQKWQEEFLAYSPSGELDKKAFTEFYHKLNPRETKTDSLNEIFDTIDVNRDGTIDFNEFLMVTVLMNRLNDLGSRLSFVFDMWDESDDGYIDRKELANLITAIYDRIGITDRRGERDPKKRAKEIIAKLDVSGDKKLSKEEFVNGCKNDPVLCDLLTSR